MQYNDRFDDDINLYSSSFEDISSNSYEDIYSGSPLGSSDKPPKGKRPKKRKKHRFLKLLCVLLCLVLVAAGALYFYAYSIIDKIERSELDRDDLGVTTSNYDSVQNIALLGIDSRADNNSGRSDAIIVLSVDKKHRKIKLTSIARDTYVSVDGRGKDKLTHAYAYGKSQLAVKTLNQNFGLEITDYVTVNFFEFARIIDFVGGVDIDISEAEMKNLNSSVIPQMNRMGIECEKISKTGPQRLTGAQAVCYARIRKIDSDIERGNRQKEVLSAMFSEVKKMSPTKLPELAAMVISECETSLSTNDIMSLGIFGLAASAEIEQLSIPNDNIKSSGKIISGAWYYVYDLELAKKEIHDFIFEENYYSKENAAERAKEKK